MTAWSIQHDAFCTRLGPITRLVRQRGSLLMRVALLRFSCGLPLRSYAVVSPFALPTALG